MHELSITRSMLEVVAREMKKSGVKRLKKVSIRVGELTAVEPDALRFCFDESIKGTPLEGAALDIENVPLSGKCDRCGTEFRIEAFSNACPKCGGNDIERTAGTELDIISIEAV
ncbi:MAG: hydrogenase maturation nickel metallochaperone HypA [Deltaproteobacteria bacterium]|nr:hydrogenase maturation nickel metallochaperone HypA [Deltaproteobacteria bacterium]